MKKCAAPGCENLFRPFLSTDRYCSSNCAYLNRKDPVNREFHKNNKPIRRRSIKGTSLDREYEKLRVQFLAQPENRFCPVTCGKTTEVHHKLGRVGFADTWARDNGIPLLIDTRFWLAVSHDGHVQITNDSEWAYKLGYSLRRTITRHGKVL